MTGAVIAISDRSRHCHQRQELSLPSMSGVVILSEAKNPCISLEAAHKIRFPKTA
jgi:hypothetical protein